MGLSRRIPIHIGPCFYSYDGGMGISENNRADGHINGIGKGLGRRVGSIYRVNKKTPHLRLERDGDWLKAV